MNPSTASARAQIHIGLAHAFLKHALAAGVCATVLCGCMDLSIPDYKRPDMPAKDSWAHTQRPVSAADTVNPEWWKAFNDPYLDALVKKAIDGNVDIKILAARIQVAGAQIGEARAGALPSADLGAGVDFEKTTGAPLTKTINLGSQVNWDIDIWGKVEKSVQAQKAEYHASEADWRAGYLTLVAGVSSTYFLLLQFDDQIAQEKKTLDKNQQILAIDQTMYANGVVPQTEVLRQKAEVNGIASELIDLQRSRDLAENALATLVGVPAGEFKVPAGHLQDRVKVPDVPMGLPAQLLSRRPDVVAAQYRILESYDQIGAAKLAQLPTISLTGRGGTAAFKLSDLFKAFTFSFLPSIDLPMLDPEVKAHIKTTEAQSQVAEQQYRQTVFAAFEEVENALVNLDAHKKQRIELTQQNAHLRVVATQIEAQLKEGVVSQLEVLESERTLASAELSLLQNQQQILTDTVTLYKAIGGGWTDVVVQNASNGSNDSAN
ncbi:efflux transporter outer membrane subunit [Trinickia violacea]|uniref:Efflux transporter outer membrane subunit n=1 Tax=Trinickia violacea TaxID=2571746 RepID=A0A4P8INP5_9BURK|nr:efflux transporter outer membrane subunit [Trinickia violacea]QCP49926.1 efflux transporter outer membrane subunit [Trinickia violacea]